MQNPFPVNPVLTAIAVGYVPPDANLIADMVMPRVSVGGQKFTYTRYNTSDSFTVPDTTVGRRSEPNKVYTGGTEETDNVVDQGLDAPIPSVDIDAWNAAPKAAGAIGPKEAAAALIARLILLGREIRVATLVQAAANYANSQALSGTARWSDYANSNPKDDLMRALDMPLSRPNTLVIGQAAWTVVRQHPKLVKSANRNSGDEGTITRQDLAELLEINTVLVGSSFVNTAKPGQSPDFVRVWGKNCALLNISSELARMQQPTWGWTAQWGDRIGYEIEDKKTGLRGSTTVRVGESVKEVVADPSSGYLFNNVVA